FKGTACSSSCGTTGYTATTSYTDTSMVVKPPVIEPGTAYGRWVLGDPFFDYLLNAAPGNEVTITSTPQISSIGKVTTTNTLHKVGTLTMTNSRALDLGIDPISGEVTIVDGSTGATCTKYTRNTVSGVLC
ncbi:receptor, partial [Enterobacter cloacae subsp. cloacae]